MSTRTPKDTFEVRSQELDSPARFAFEIDAGGSDLAYVTRGLYIGTSGNVFCRMAGYANNVAGTYMGGNHANIFFMNAVGGTILPLRLDKVWVRNESDTSQNTTSVELVGLY